MQAARNLDVFPCSGAAAKTSSLAADIHSTIINCMKPAFVDSVRGVTRTFSSNGSTGYGISVAAWQTQCKAKTAGWQAQREAMVAAWQARQAASEAEIKGGKLLSSTNL
ncbi:hypothetical protein ACP70R_000519 [Stipagrostis hirtigluma subsp. patula]